MFEVIRWVSLVILWLCITLNLWCIVRSRRFIKNWDKIINESSQTLKECEALRDQWLERIKEVEKKEQLLEAEGKYCNTMIAACTEFLGVAREETNLKEEKQNETDAL